LPKQPNLIYTLYKLNPVPDEEKIDLKKRIAQAAGINPKTVERGAKNLIWMLFGVDEKDLERDPALRAFVNYKLYGDNPAPYIILDVTNEETDEEKSTDADSS
jgi:hypothetical protein